MDDVNIDMPGTPDSMPSLDGEGAILAEETIVIDPSVMYRDVTVDGESSDGVSKRSEIQQLYRQRKFDGLTNIYEFLRMNSEADDTKIKKQSRQVALLTHPDKIPVGLSKEEHRIESEKRDHLRLLADTAFQVLTHTDPNGDRDLKRVYDLGLDMEQGRVQEDDPRLVELMNNWINALTGAATVDPNATGRNDPDYDSL